MAGSCEARSVSWTSDGVQLPDDPEEASARYMRIRECVRETFRNFLRDLGSQSLKYLEREFERVNGELGSRRFLRVFSRVFSQPQMTELLGTQEQRFAVQLAIKMLFEGMDVDSSGIVSWMEFVEFVCATAEEMRLKAQELSGQTFDFEPSSISVPYRPAAPKCHFDKVFYWPGLASESAESAVIIFEQGSHKFHLHRPSTMARKKQLEGHAGDVLAAAWLEKPFQQVVTSGNDGNLCFWDDQWKLVRKWKVKHVVGELCWCDNVRVLYMARAALFDPGIATIKALRLESPMIIRDTEKMLKLDKSLEFCSDHKKPVQCMVWLPSLQTLATGSLDSTIQVFDFVQLKQTHVLSGHKKAVTCLEWCPKNQYLLSAGFDNYINIWDPTAGLLSHRLLGHECSIAGLCAVPRTDYEFLSVDFDGVVKLWDVRRLLLDQSFHATDRQAEQAGDIEVLEARAICPLSRDRVLIAGRRLVVFDRSASDPRLTADSPISDIRFHHGKIEIITPIKNDLYIWCGLTGELLSIKDNVCDGNITALTLCPGERRVFIGTTDGDMHAINYACGALLKSLTPHECEVSQIECTPGKILSLSSPQKVVLVHDDNDEKRAVLLRKIDLSGAGAPLLQIAHDGQEVLVGGSEWGDVFWYNMDFAKQVASSEKNPVDHEGSAVTSCTYLKTAPLVLTADTKDCVIFWSLRPLRSYYFFNKAILSLADAGTVGITAMAVAEPEEDYILIGTDSGGLARVCIESVVENAKRQAEDILKRKEGDEAAEVISGRIFDKLPKPANTPDYVFNLPSLWLVQGAHRGQVDRVIHCRRRPSIVLTLGMDACVRMWAYDTGEALGTLEQGLPEGLAYERESQWRFLLDAHEQVRIDRQALAEFAFSGSQEEEEAEEEAESRLATPSAHSRQGNSRSQSKSKSKGLLGKDSTRSKDKNLPQMSHSQSAPDLRGSKKSPSGFGGQQPLCRVPRAARVAEPPLPSGEWLAGPLSTAYLDNLASLPPLRSGLPRRPSAASKGILEAAQKLSNVLGTVPSRADLL